MRELTGKIAEEIYNDTKGDPVMVKFAVFGRGLEQDVEEMSDRYLGSQLARKTMLASEFGNSAKIIVPRSWLRKRVIALLHSEFISKHAEERKADE